MQHCPAIQVHSALPPGVKAESKIERGSLDTAADRRMGAAAARWEPSGPMLAPWELQVGQPYSALSLGVK